MCFIINLYQKSYYKTATPDEIQHFIEFSVRLGCIFYITLDF